MDHDADYLATMAQLMQLSGGSMTPEHLLDHHEFEGTFDGFSRFESATTFGAMLLDPRLQSNCTRVEALVHLAVAFSRGDRLPTNGEVKKCFDALNDGMCGRMEDPAEDIFVGQIVSERGNFLVLEGIWESGTFLLQRFVEIVETMPDDELCSSLKDAVFALLELSHATCQRESLRRNMLGQSRPFARLPSGLGSKRRRGRVVFTIEDLDELGVSVDSLQQFVFEDELRAPLKKAEVSASPLQQFPIIREANALALVLPTAVSYAIRDLVIRFAIEFGMVDSLRQTLVKSYERLFRESHLLGSFVKPNVRFAAGDVQIAEIGRIADKGRFIHFLFYADSLDDYTNTGLTGQDPTSMQALGQIEEKVHAAASEARKIDGFQEGLSLVVHCGVGRSVFLPIPNVPDWQVKALFAPDLHTLSSVPNYDATSLMKSLRAKDEVERHGVKLVNANGILNLVAWIRSNEGHLVPHRQVPKNFRLSDGTIFLAPEFVADIRRDANIATDYHGVRYVDGEMHTVRRLGGSYFAEDNEHPLYAAIGAPSSSVFLSANRAWWCEVNSENRNDGFELWQTLNKWITKIVPSLEPLVHDGLPKSILVRLQFSPTPSPQTPREIPDRHELRDSISISLNEERATAVISFGVEFDHGLASPVNISERALVRAVCEGVARLANMTFTSDELTDLENRIVPNDFARHRHAFYAKSFREYVHSDLDANIIRQDEQDVAAVRLGLAFRVESREKGRSSTRSKVQSCKLLNGIVRNLEDELCGLLEKYDRRMLVEMALRNCEVARMNRRRWMETARANLAMHVDVVQARETIKDHDAQHDSAIVLSRLLIEFAHCTCPLENGIAPGMMDISKLLAIVGAIHHLGGWSDAIHRDAMAPSLVITALGDVQASTEFDRGIVMPFVKQGSDNRIDAGIQSYDDRFETDREEVGEVREGVEDEFENAFAEEFGYSILDGRRFMDSIEDIGIAAEKAVFFLKTSELEREVANDVTAKKFQAILNSLVLRCRDSWRSVPEDFDKKDIEPWRFRRQLSAVRRPLIQIDQGDDPELLIAPGFVRDCFVYILSSYREGSFPDRHYKTKQMRKWQDGFKKRRGKDLVRRVAEEIRKRNGWQVMEERGIKELIGVGHDEEFGNTQKFGDVDVLAWNNDLKRVLAIECKHLQFHKSSGEIAEQLGDYRGRVKQNGKPDDLLRHIKRLEVLKARKHRLFKKLKVDSGSLIEGWIVFKNPVPMLYCWQEFEEVISIATEKDIGRIIERD